MTICHLANYNTLVETTNLGEIIKQQRVMVHMTLQKLAVITGISPSYLGRIERGERFPSAHVLRKIAEPLGFDENELFTLAGYLSPHLTNLAEAEAGYSGKRLDPCVSKMLAQESVDVQRAVIGILSVLKSVAKGMIKEGR